MGVLEPGAAVETALKVHTAGQDARQRNLTNTLNVLNTADKLLGVSEERQFQRQAALEMMKEGAAERRQAAQLGEQRRHNMAVEANTRETLLLQKDNAAALKSYREGLLDLRRLSAENAKDKALTADARAAWKDFNSTSNEIAKAARSKSGTIPFETYDTWANHAMRLKQLGEDVNVTIPLSAKGWFSDDTVEVTPEEWLQIRRFQAAHPDTTIDKIVPLVKQFRSGAGG